MSLKVVSVGVLPLIFAYSFLAFPGTIAQLVAPNGGFATWWNAYMKTGSWLYMVVSGLLIIAFTFFYSSISFDPKQQAEQLQQQGKSNHFNLISKLGWMSSVQFSRSVVSDPLRPHESQHARPPCPSPTPGVHSDSSIESVMPSSHLILSSPSPPAPNPSQHQSLFQ